jgi:signal transduction histidine kinase
MFTTKSAGTGMGLFICRQLLGRMGAHIYVEETAMLIGTTFVIEFPKA